MTVLEIGGDEEHILHRFSVTPPKSRHKFCTPIKKKNLERQVWSFSLGCKILESRVLSGLFIPGCPGHRPVLPNLEPTATYGLGALRTSLVATGMRRM